MRACVHARAHAVRGVRCGAAVCVVEKESEAPSSSSFLPSFFLRRLFFQATCTGLKNLANICKYINTCIETFRRGSLGERSRLN